MEFLYKYIQANKQLIFIILILVLLPFILYYPSLKYDFIESLDDGWLITSNNSIKHLSLYGIKYLFLYDNIEPMHYHPFFFISLSIDYFFFGLNPYGYKLHNLLLHIAVGILIFTFVNLMIKNKWIAFLVALFFVIHPVNIESVAWAVSRRFSLFFFYFLASMIAYKLYLEERLKQYNFLLFITSIILWIISLLAKETAIVMPAIIFLIYLSEKRDSFKVKSISKHILVMIPVMVLFWHLASRANDTNFLKRDFHYSYLQHLIFAGYSYSFYWMKGIYPFPLSVFYPSPSEHFDLHPLAIKYYLLFFSSSILFLLLIYHLIKKHNLLFFALAYYTVTILPVLNMMFYPLGDMPMLGANRYFYQASLGILLYLIIIINHLIKKNVFKIGLSMAFSVFLILFFRIHITSWKNQFTLFEESVKNYPNEEFLYRLAIEYEKIGKTKEALIYLEKADNMTTDIWINNVWIYYQQRSHLYLKSGKYNKALSDINIAISKTDFKTPHYDSVLIYDKANIESIINKK